jgi:PIN domain nuclease of toxin-antitoxin system
VEVASDEQLECLRDTPTHAWAVRELPAEAQRDAFARMLVAQVRGEGLAIVSVDQERDAYPVPRLW